MRNTTPQASPRRPYALLKRYNRLLLVFLRVSHGLPTKDFSVLFHLSTRALIDFVQMSRPKSQSCKQAP